VALIAQLLASCSVLRLDDHVHVLPLPHFRGAFHLPLLLCTIISLSSLWLHHETQRVEGSGMAVQLLDGPC
jgi:hypothetical protein